MAGALLGLSAIMVIRQFIPVDLESNQILGLFSVRETAVVGGIILGAIFGYASRPTYEKIEETNKGSRP